ncbi:MAG: putative secondary metabolism biosynthetic enzyme [Bathelium mastoideum]|nr:MAG: putative secondary metabolism biosynthetic enzyme [Bathelium mastoideum]KAI9694093.1 MAG: putative secondary metabolism biosynthetic enzyme [Bathelium mastoideum]
MSSSGQHLAAVITAKGSRFVVQHRPTPEPGPGELLLEVKSVALNPLDILQRDVGFVVGSYPAVVASDVGGIVLKAGPSVPPDAPKVGSRVTAFANNFYSQASPNYGALQTRVLVRASMACAIPDGVSSNEAATLPMQVGTTWSGFYSIGIPRSGFEASAKQGLLVWGAASSVGCGVVQAAKSLGFIVYATASEKHHGYIKKLGAHHVFDYKSKDVVERIVKAAKQDGVTLNMGYTAVGGLEECQAILKEFKGKGTSKLASAPPLQPDAPTAEGVKQKFVLAPDAEEARDEHFHFAFIEWLQPKLASGEYLPSPQIKVVDGGLESANKALDELKAGVSATKLVLEL